MWPNYTRCECHSAQCELLTPLHSVNYWHQQSALTDSVSYNLDRSSRLLSMRLFPHPHSTSPPHPDLPPPLSLYCTVPMSVWMKRHCAHYPKLCFDIFIFLCVDKQGSFDFCIFLHVDGKVFLNIFYYCIFLHVDEEVFFITVFFCV